MKNKLIKHYVLIVAFLGVAIIFYNSEGDINLPKFLIFLFSGILIGINIIKIKNADKDA
jgi:Na+/glutamate symporter